MQADREMWCQPWRPTDVMSVRPSEELDRWRYRCATRSAVDGINWALASALCVSASGLPGTVLDVIPA